MSESYVQHIYELMGWFLPRLRALGAVRLTKAQYEAGTDSLPAAHAALVREAHTEWLSSRNYELSYNQMNQAFFGVLLDIGYLTVTE